MKAILLASTVLGSLLMIVPSFAAAPMSTCGERIAAVRGEMMETLSNSGKDQAKSDLARAEQAMRGHNDQTCMVDLDNATFAIHPASTAP